MRRIFQPTTLLTVGCLAFLLGMWAARYEPGFSLSWLLVVPACAVFLTKRTILAVAALVVAGLLLGLWRGSMGWQDYRLYDDYFGTKVTLEVRAAEDGVYDDRSQLAFAADSVTVLHENGTWQTLPGRIQVGGFGAPAVYRGDIVLAEGKLFPSRGSKVARMSFAELEVSGRPKDYLETSRREFVAGMQTALPEPAASFGLGILVGQRTTLPEEVEDNFSKAGFTHIVAVSGYNLTILVNLARRLFAKRSHFQSIVLAAGLIACFLLITGFGASIVRAAIVSGMSLAAAYYGRSFKPVLLIALAAVMTTIMNPLYIWFDIGWYLSFASFFGVVVVVPLIAKRYWKKKEPGLVAQMCIESGCAQIMTLPIIAFIFGEVAVYSLVSNIFVLPLIPLAMLFSLFAGLAGMVMPVLAGLVAWPAYAALTYVLDVAAIFARLPHSVVDFKLSAWEMGGMYAGLFGFCWLLHARLKRLKEVVMVQ